jgi:hypothetical protein
VTSSVSVPLVPIRVQSRRALNECIADGSFRAFLLSGQRLHNVAPASLCAARACACSPTSRARSSRWNCQQPIPRAGRCEDEDFEAARVDGYKTIDITDFVAYEAIGPIFFAKTYYVGPDKGAEKTYSLLVKAMEDAKLAGIAKFLMRDKQHLGALRIRDGVITLEQLYFADEIRSIDEIEASRVRVSQQELKMAQQLMDSWTTE